LAARETLELEFPPTVASSGLVLGARHSFVSTYVFYQMLAYLGRSAGSWLAQLERDGPERMPQALGLMRALGGIEIAVAEPDGSWRHVGTYDEAGPIATDVQLFPIPNAAAGRPLRVRLRMARGSWRVGYVALAGRTVPATSTVLDPIVVERHGVADGAALAALRDATRHLTTFPGDEYRLTFALPGDGAHYALFLESRGYYYEWMRDEWLAEESPAMVALAVMDPAAVLRRIAPAFKETEPRIEELFWRSRFGHGRAGR
jgi:hypothetical protein